ncbi:MAG: membrane dipeptidase [Lachnospiraceae bacterium]|nr:membrane dipeptidase [Lachnospiraceae bacterium]
MNFIDLHCDTLTVFADREHPGSLFANESGVDFQKMKAGGVTAQFFAVWLPEEAWWKSRELTPMADEVYLRLLSEHFYRELEAHGDIIGFAGNEADLIRNEKGGRMSAFLTLENSRILAGDLTNVEVCYQKGIRLMTLTWNDPNCLGAAHSEDSKRMGTGLTPFGREAVRRMEELGIAVDVSHLSDGGFWDVADVLKGPFLASHSNARALAGNTRNLTDEMIKKIGDRGGVIGLNFAPQFLNPDLAADVSRISCLCAHAAHIRNKGGAECLALGTDLDGIEGELEIPGSRELPLLWEALKNYGFTESELEKFGAGNARRFIGDVMR